MNYNVLVVVNRVTLAYIYLSHDEVIQKRSVHTAPQLRCIGALYTHAMLLHCGVA